jgi:coenzyme A diphosphatase NUDT7
MELANRATADFPFDLLPRHPHDWYKRKGYNIYFYEYQGHVIWGLTARILHGFIKRFHKELQANIL